MQAGCTIPSKAVLMTAWFWNVLLEMSCLLTTTTVCPSSGLSSSLLCPFPYLEGSPLPPCSSIPLQELAGMNFGVPWSETPTLTNSVSAHTVFSLEKWTEPFKEEESHSFFTGWSQKLLSLPLQCEKQRWLEHAPQNVAKANLLEQGHTMGIHVYLEWLQGVWGLLSSFPVEATPLYTWY